jgi:hypothetical protein
LPPGRQHYLLPRYLPPPLYSVLKCCIYLTWLLADKRKSGGRKEGARKKEFEGPAAASFFLVKRPYFFNTTTTAPDTYYFLLTYLLSALFYLLPRPHLHFFLSTFLRTQSASLLRSRIGLFRSFPPFSLSLRLAWLRHHRSFVENFAAIRRRRTKAAQQPFEWFSMKPISGIVTSNKSIPDSFRRFDVFTTDVLNQLWKGMYIQRKKHA